MEAIKVLAERFNIKLGQLIFAGGATSTWNWLTDSEIGVVIANITGLLIILLLLRKFAFAMHEDLLKLYHKKKQKQYGRKDDHNALISDEGDVLKSVLND